jgi:hypothetical protein
MTAIIYLGEMLVASLFAIVLLAISRLPMSSDAVLRCVDPCRKYRASFRAAWSCTNRIPAASCQSMTRSSQFFGRYGFVSRWSV